MKPRVIVLLLAIAALLAKLYCAATTIGTTDVVFFYKFATTIHEQGLLAMYRATPLFNHTPLIGWFAEAAYAICDGEKPYFAFYLRLPAIFADFFSVLALLWFREKTGRPGWWAMAIYAASPVAFMVSGYHGNVDSLMAFGILMAGLACALDRPALCGLCLGLACNVKIIPLVLAPAFFFLWWQRRQVLRFTLPAVATVLIGWSYPLVTIPAIFLKDVLGYGSIWGVWGITYAFRLTDRPEFRNIAFVDTTPAQAAIMSTLKIIIVVSALTLAWRRRKVVPMEIFQTLALIWAVFFVFAPGFGAQYLAWLMPCFLVANERWYAWLTASSSVALFVFYNVISHGMPWRQGFTVHSTAAQWTGWMVLPWLVLAGFLGWNARLLFAKSDTKLAAQPVSGPVPAVAN